MAQPLYDLFITGKLVDGISDEEARENFARLFKTSSDKVARYFNENPTIFKRGIEKAEALKYKAALHKAGILVTFKAHKADIAQEISNSAESIQPTPQTSPQSSLQTKTETQQQPQPLSQQAPLQTGTLSMAPVGTDVLMPNERSEFVEANIDTSDIKMASIFTESDNATGELPPAPNTSHISVAAVGEDLLIEKPEPTAPLPLDLDDITLAPAGAKLEQLIDDLPEVNPDISALDIAPPGVDLLEGTSKPQPPPPPDTSHLSVSND